MQTLQEYINEGLIRNFFKKLRNFFFGTTTDIKTPIPIDYVPQMYMPSKTKKAIDEKPKEEHKPAIPKEENEKLKQIASKQFDIDKKKFLDVMIELAKKSEDNKIKDGTVIKIVYKMTKMSQMMKKTFGNEEMPEDMKVKKWWMWYVTKSLSIKDIEKSLYRTNYIQCLNGGVTQKFEVYCSFFVDVKNGRPYIIKDWSFNKYPLIQISDIDSIIINNDNDIEDCANCIKNSSLKDKDKISEIILNNKK